VGGPVTMTGSMYAADVLGTNLSSSHPFSLILPINDAPDLVSTLSGGQTADTTGAIKLINGNIECTSCHNPHVQAKDLVAQNFLVKDSSKGSMCLACHDPNRVVQGQTNPLAGWFQSIHATATDGVTNLPYPTLDQNACENCHTNHNAPGGEWLLRGAGDQVCLNCHSGTSANPGLAKAQFVNPNGNVPPSVLVSTAVAARLNVASEYAKIGHPLSTENKPIVTKAQLQAQNQSQVPSPNTPNLSGCTDCHDPHAVQSATGSGSAPAPGLRPSQRLVSGVSEKDGTIVRPAQEQYQVCIRCHGASTNKPRMSVTKYGYMPVRLESVADPTDVIPQFNSTAVSSHPVFLPRRSPLPQPSLLTNMWNLDGTTKGRPLGAQILCTDCHNSDNNREFGGTGPNGPHGSKWSHILERRYEFSQTAVPGHTINNLFPTPDLSVNGPYALCGKCHNLTSILQNVSFAQHSSHINAGFSCSTCHTAHGTATGSTNLSGERLINFDMGVVAPNAGQPVSYNRSINTCTLTCHNVAHNSDGSVKAGTGAGLSSHPH
jgi:predicted CXXCH cytochrome family protein